MFLVLVCIFVLFSLTTTTAIQTAKYCSQRIYVHGYRYKEKKFELNS